MSQKASILKKSTPLILILLLVFLGGTFHFFDFFTGESRNREVLLEKRADELEKKNIKLENRIIELENKNIDTENWFNELDGFAHDLENRMIDLEDNIRKK